MQIPKSWLPMIAGGIAANAPTLLNLATVDQIVLTDISLSASLGYIVRLIAFFFMGVLVVAINKEDNWKKAVQIGMLAPTLLTSYLNGRQATPVETAPAAIVEQQEKPSSFLWVPVAHADEVQAAPAPVTSAVKILERPRESGAQQFLRGLLGSWKKDDSWFVVLDQYETLPRAIEAIHKMDDAKKMGNIRPEVYVSGKIPAYFLIAGSNLTRIQAEVMLQRALAAGYGTAMIWTYPDPVTD